MVNVDHAAGAGAGLVIVGLHPSEKSDTGALLKRQYAALVLEHNDAFACSLYSCFGIFVPIKD